MATMDYEAIVIGAGHAGIEASLALARLGKKTLLITQDIATIGRMSCNPSIGGLAKGNLVKEIDALGGEMGKLIDSSMLQFRMLNRSRGPAVQGPRAQADKELYAASARRAVEGEPLLQLFMDTVVDIVTNHIGDTIEAVITSRGCSIGCKALVLTTGTFMEAKLFIGSWTASGGRLGETAAVGLGTALRKRGFTIGRFKTGTPARIRSCSIDYNVLERQDSDSPEAFSFVSNIVAIHKMPCWISYTNETVHNIIRKNTGRSPLFSGAIKGKGPRYCPSIEDKVLRFPTRERHQIFIEPESASTDESYLNGLSTSLPEDIQLQFIQSIKGLSDAIMTRPGYAVEYDYLAPTQLYHSLMTKKIKGMFVAGQTNGTSGYEEAAAQGLISGINAALYLSNLPAFELSRKEAYIGVLIDDLVSLGVDEPYRMFTSRAEHRLSLRQDSADLRLTDKAYRIGLASTERQEKLLKKKDGIAAIRTLIEKRKITQQDSNMYKELLPLHGQSLATILSQPQLREIATALISQELISFPPQWVQSVALDLQYAGYLERENKLAERAVKEERMHIPADFDFTKLVGVSHEAKEKFLLQKPSTLKQAAEITGLRKSDLFVLMATLLKLKDIE